MKTIQRSVDAACNPEALYDFILDLSRGPEWNHGMRDVRNVNGRGVGATSEWTYRMGDVDLDVRSETIVADRPSRIVMRTTGGAFSEWTYRIDPSPIGARITLHVAYEIPPTVKSRVAESLLLNRNARDVEMLLENVKDLVEHEAGALV